MRYSKIGIMSFNLLLQCLISFRDFHLMSTIRSKKKSKKISQFLKGIIKIIFLILNNYTSDRKSLSTHNWILMTFLENLERYSVARKILGINHIKNVMSWKNSWTNIISLYSNSKKIKQLQVPENILIFRWILLIILDLNCSFLFKITVENDV